MPLINWYQLIDVIDKYWFKRSVRIFFFCLNLLSDPLTVDWPRASEGQLKFYSVWNHSSLREEVRWHLHQQSEFIWTPTSQERAHPAVSPTVMLPQEEQPLHPRSPRGALSPPLLTAWCLSTEPRVSSPKGLQFSSVLHIPHISTCVKGKQLCSIFSLTGWKEKQRKLKSEVLFCTVQRINDAFPTSSTFPSKLTC